MKKVVIILIMTCFLFSCSTSVTQIGDLNMISTRNITIGANYVQLTTYSGGSKKELKKLARTTLEDAVSETVKFIPGGEFITNCRVYLVNRRYYAVEGDVWGIKQNEIIFRGFKIGDRVTWMADWKAKRKYKKEYLIGKVISFKDIISAIVILDVDSSNVLVKYEDMSKIGIE